MKVGIVMNYPMNAAFNNNMMYQLEEEHINELQEWEGLSSG
jgi:hypothetical protein